MREAFKKFDLTGKTALVTGGATGIGYHITRALMSSGAKVMIAARREHVLQEAAEQLKSQAPTAEILYHCVDLAARDSVRALASHCDRSMGGVDIFVGNAGVDIFEHIGNIKDESIDQSFQVNLSANLELMRAFLPRMRKAKWGRILFSSSASSVQSSAQEGMAVYAATKAGLNAIARTAAAEAGHDGVTVNSLAFGLFLTPMLKELLAHLEKEQGAEVAKDFVDSLTGSAALGRMGTCDELEGVIQLLASDAGSFITGATIAVDGGMTAMLRPNPPAR